MYALARTNADGRILGITMPTIDYAAFKRLEVRLAAPDDPEVIRLARKAMTEPMEPLKASHWTIKQSRQAILVNKALRRKVSLHAFSISQRKTACETGWNLPVTGQNTPGRNPRT